MPMLVERRTQLLLMMPLPAWQVRRLAPFVLLSLLLHATLLLVVRPPVADISSTRQHTLSVYFSAPPHSEQASPAAKSDARSHTKQISRPVEPRPAVVSPAAQAETTPAVASPSVFDTQQWRESARDIVRDEARKIERQIATEELKRRNTPAGMLAQELRQTGKEIRLANGMLKIITAAGAVCFQPIPYYARDSAGLYGIATTCP